MRNFQQSVFRRLSRAGFPFVLWLVACGGALLTPPAVSAAGVPHVVLIGGDAEYSSRETCASIEKKLREDFGFRTTLINSYVGSIENEESLDTAIPNLEVIRDADLLIIYVRMRWPPQEQLELLHEYFESGRPAIGIRTTTHAFTNDRGWCPRYFGGHYWAHFGGSTEIHSVAAMRQHPILRGVPATTRLPHNSLYITNPLSDTATALVLGRKDERTPSQTYAWINEYKPGSRQFFYTASHPADIAEPANEALLYNAIYWCLKLEVPGEGVLADPVAARKMLAERRAFSATARSDASPPPPLEAPAAAHTLFDGSDLDQWDYWFGGKEPRAYELDERAHSGEGLPEFTRARWRIDDEAVVTTPGYGDLLTRDEFTDYRLHVDFLVPASDTATPVIWRGNSGVFLNGCYEIQILDSEQSELNETSCGAITGQRAPDYDSAKRAGQWQSLDIWFRSPRFTGGRKTSPARATVVLNGQTVHDNVAISRPTEWGFAEERRRGPIRLQSDAGEVRFANIWVLPLSAQQVAERLPNVRELTGKPWIDMDYGPNLTLTLEAGEENFAYKGVAIRLDEGPGGVSQGNEFVIFDTDTLRYAAGWMGPEFIDWRCIHFNGEHAVHPRVAGAVLFENPPGPGWARPGASSFSDERLVGRDGKHYGPLERQWAHWRGHYHHGNQVILSYIVGETDVLETPSAEATEDLRAFVRTVNLGPHSEDLIVQVAHDPTAEVAQHPFHTGTVAAEFVTLRSGASSTAAREQAGQQKRRTADDGPESEDTEVEENEQPEQGVFFDGATAAVITDGGALNLEESDFTIWARIDTEDGGTIFAKAPAESEWEPGAKALFIREGQLAFDVGWVGVIESDLDELLNDGEIHEVAMTYAQKSQDVKLYADGRLVAEGSLETGESAAAHVVKLGFASGDFPEERSAFIGHVPQVRFFDRVLQDDEIVAVGRGEDVARGLIAQWDRVFDGMVIDRIGGHHAKLVDVEDFSEDVEGEEGTTASGGPALGSVLCVGLVGDSAGCKWIAAEDGHLRLKIPANADRAAVKIVYARVESLDDLPSFEKLLSASEQPANLVPLTRGGPQKWTKTITTSPAIVGNTDGPFVAEAISVPHDNPYRSWMRLGGFDFFADGKSAAVCTWQGDVWTVDGLGSDLADGSTLRWRRIASGMFQPLGLKIVDGDIYVTCRDQITILRDFNGDGETDFYENFNNDHQVTDHFHEFAVGLQRDEEGNFYYAKCARHALDALVPHHGTLLKVTPDGLSTEILARGYRAPNGVCINGDGTFFLSDQEGHWTPKNRINWVQPGGFYGNMMAYHEGRAASDFEPPVCWIHNDVDRSPAEQVWVNSDQWGPLQGSLITLSYGTGEMHLVLHEVVDGVMQGGLVRLPVSDFPTGVMRGRFHPGDGQLYCCGLFGWSSNKTAPGGFYRVRYTGQPVHMPTQLHATERGLTIKFAEPLDTASVTNYRNWSASRWEYRRTQNYGSEDYRLGTPPRRGRDRVRIESVELGVDKRTVHLNIRDMRPAMQMELRYQIKTADGRDLSQFIHHTVHKVGVSAATKEQE